jgi:glucose/mannose transport system substrate-binding protein
MPSDLAALSVCREALGQRSIELLDASCGAPAMAKMHGMELSETSASALCDLGKAARDGHWRRLPHHVRRYMVRGPAWFGLPMGIHESNWVWLHPSTARRIGSPLHDSVGHIDCWLSAAKRYASAPLAVGEQPWQLGVILESLVLAHGGSALYRAALERVDGRAWLSPPLQRAVAQFLSLRSFVDNDALTLDWRAQLQRVRTGESAMLFMGDWVRPNAPELQMQRVPGTGSTAITIADFFVPMAGADADTAQEVAEALAHPAVQKRFADVKGCRPVFVEATSRPPPTVTHQVPSLTFEQSCARALRERVLAIAADHFLRGANSRECVAALAVAPAPMQE